MAPGIISRRFAQHEPQGNPDFEQYRMLFLSAARVAAVAPQELLSVNVQQKADVLSKHLHNLVGPDYKSTVHAKESLKHYTAYGSSKPVAASN